MHSRSSIHSSVVFGLSAAVIASVISNMTMSLPSWKHPPSNTSEVETTFTLMEPVCQCSCPPLQVSWYDVFQFLGKEFSEVDPQWAIIAASLLVMLAHRLRRNFKPVMQNNSTSTETDLSDSCLDESNSNSDFTQYELRQRALLQFQKNKSEPINFKYGYKDNDDLDDSDIDEKSIAEIIRRYSLRNPSPSVRASSEDPTDRTLDTMDQDNTTLSHASKLASKSDRVSGTSVFSRDEDISCKVVSKSSNSSLTIHFQPSYPKPKLMKAELNQEQVYSEPFIY